jgi:predicted nucleic acid-binding protein
MYLIDTDVLSLLRRPERVPGIAAWIGRLASDQLYLSAASMMEIERGITRCLSTDPAYAGDLSDWRARVIALYGARILPIDTQIAQRWGMLAARIGNSELDLAIAATALEHRLTVVTRNVSNFLPTGVTLFDPFTGTHHPPS